VLEIEHASGILWASDVDIAGLANCRDGPGGVARVRANIPEIDPQSNPWVTFANRSEIYFWGLRIAAFGGHGAGSNRLPSAYRAARRPAHAGVVALHGRAPYTSAEQRFGSSWLPCLFVAVPPNSASVSEDGEGLRKVKS
jgi:hypothetical protein